MKFLNYLFLIALLASLSTLLHKVQGANLKSKGKGMFYMNNTAECLSKWNYWAKNYYGCSVTFDSERSWCYTVKNKENTLNGWIFNPWRWCKIIKSQMTPLFSGTKYLYF